MNIKGAFRKDEHLCLRALILELLIFICVFGFEIIGVITLSDLLRSHFSIFLSVLGRRDSCVFFEDPIEIRQIGKAGEI